MTDGQATQALVLSPQGHVEHHFVVTELDGTSYLDTEPGAGAALLGYLDGMRFWSKVEVTDASAEFALLTLIGPDAPGRARAHGARRSPIPARAGPPRCPTGGFVRRTDEGIDLLVPRAQLAAHRDRADRRPAPSPAGSWAADALRIPTRRPRLGVDTDDRTIPNEVQWLITAVHLEKGCYRGQETVARVHNLGRPPRRLVMLNLDGSAVRPARDRRTGHHGRRPGRRPGRHGRPAPRGRPDRAGPGQAHRRRRDPAAGRHRRRRRSTRPTPSTTRDRSTPVSAIDRRAFSQIRRELIRWHRNWSTST